MIVTLSFIYYRTPSVQATFLEMELRIMLLAFSLYSRFMGVRIITYAISISKLKVRILDFPRINNDIPTNDFNNILP